MQALLGDFTTEQLLWYSIGGVVVLALLIYWMKGRVNPEKVIRKTVLKNARDVVENVYIPDGLGEHMHLEYLILTPAGLVVVDTMRVPGNVFGAEKLELWTQVYNKRSYKFSNPLLYNELKCITVRSVSGKVPVYGLVLFADDSQFPKGIPARVATTSSFAQELKNLPGPAQKTTTGLDQAWQAVLSTIFDKNKTTTLAT